MVCLVQWLSFGASLILSLIDAHPTVSSKSNGAVVEIAYTHNIAKCLDLPGGNTSNGNLLWLWDCNGLINQKWIHVGYGAKHKIVYAMAPSKCIDVPAGDFRNGNQLQLWDCLDVIGQNWDYDASAKTVYLASSSSDASKCMDLKGGSTDNGNAIEVWDCNGSPNQQWAFRVPPTPPPSPPSPPTPENPLGITPFPKRSDNFFLIIGDWGAPDWGSRGCQGKVAHMMKAYVESRARQGKKCLFIAAVGDNFYAAGVRDSSHWQKQWADVYGTNDPSSGLHDIPWLAVMGNHDIGNDDPLCACGGGCKQFNNGPRPAFTKNKYWMPDFYWHYYISEIKLEIIGLDTNAMDVGGIGGDGCGNGGRITCEKCGGQPNIQNFLNGKMDAGEKLLEERARTTQATTALIMQHYNGYGAVLKKRFDGINHGRTKTLVAYGHAHDQVCEGSREHGCDTILTGGGGGWRGGGFFGFTAVHLTDDGGYHTVLETSEVRTPQNSCQYLDDNVTDHADGAVWLV